jgi:catechol 2,3-dioxygenase-like lactoylglutathione lyase family enzyme
MDQYAITPMLPASDLERARRWYEEKLGLVPARESPAGLEYRSGGARFDIYETQFAGTAQNTAAAIIVGDIEKVVDDLAGRGVVFEQYDFGEIKTDDRGIADIPGERAAWFKDSEGNIIGLGQTTS